MAPAAFSQAGQSSQARTRRLSSLVPRSHRCLTPCRGKLACGRPGRAIHATSRTSAVSKNGVFLSHLYIKTNILPRQARDKHGENSKKDRVSTGGHPVYGCVRKRLFHWAIFRLKNPNICQDRLRKNIGKKLRGKGVLCRANPMGGDDLFRVYFGGADAVVGSALISVKLAPMAGKFSCERHGDSSGLSQCVPDEKNGIAGYAACNASCGPPPPPHYPMTPGKLYTDTDIHGV
jgi:hypothetical protein